MLSAGGEIAGRDASTKRHNSVSMYWALRLSLAILVSESTDREVAVL